MRQPAHTTEVLAAVQRRPGLTVRGLASELSVAYQVAYRALAWLEAAGEVERDDARGWHPAERESPLVELWDTIDAVERLLAEAMRMPVWEVVPRSVQHKVEHACVEIKRLRGEVD